MEPLRLLQFWHIPSDKNPAAVRDSPTTDITLTSTTTNDKEGRHAIEETDDEDSFFDLDFTVPLKKNSSKQHDDVLPRKPLPNPHSPPPPKLRLHMLLKNPDADKEFQIFSVLNSNTIGNRTPTTTKLHKQRRFPKVVIQKYLKLINPFYYSRGASKRCTDQTDEISKMTPFSSPRKQVQQEEKQGIRAGNHLGKSRSASSAVRAAPARRDDSLLLHDDGIQSAILHCKRSYNSSSGFYVLSRSARSEPSGEVSVNNRCRNSTEDVKTRNSI